MIHLSRVCPDHIDESQPFIIEEAAVLLLQNPRESVDRPERSPEVVRNGIGECLQFFVFRLQFPRTPGNPFFQFEVHSPDLFLRPPPVGNIKIDHYGSFNTTCIIYNRRGIVENNLFPPVKGINLKEFIGDSDTFANRMGKSPVIRGDLFS